MSKKEIDVSGMPLENGVYVDYFELCKGNLNANPKKTIIGFKCYDAVDHKFVGLVDENKIACWYVSEKSCTKAEEIEVDYSRWYVGNVYAPRNKTKMGKEVAKGFKIVETTTKESVRLMTPAGEIKDVFEPVAIEAKEISTVADIAEDSALYIAETNEDELPIVGYKIFGRRTGEYKGLVDLHGEYFNIEEGKLKRFCGPCELAMRYI